MIKKHWLPASLLSALIIVALGNLFIPRSYHLMKTLFHYSSTHEHEWLNFNSGLRTLSYEASHQNHENKIFILGGSGARASTDCGILQEELKDKNLSCYNFARAAMGPFELYMYRHQIFSARPKMLIILLGDESFDDYYDIGLLRKYGNIHYLAHLVQFLSWQDLWEYRLFFLRPILNSASFFFQHSRTLKEIIPKILEDLLNGTLDTNANPSSIHVMHAVTEKSAKERILEKMRSDEPGRKKSQRIVGSAMFVNAFTSFLTEARERGISTIVVYRPHYGLIEELKEYTLRTTHHLEEMRPFFKELNIDYLPEDELSFFHAGDFFDYRHLNEIGRKKFTFFLKDYLHRKVPVYATRL